MKVRLIASTELGPFAPAFASKVCTSKEVPDPLDSLAQTMRKGEPHPLKSSLESAMKSGHWSVLEHWSGTFVIEGISRACSHQLVRHRLASYEQQSQRFVDMSDFRYVTPDSIATDDQLRVEYEDADGDIVSQSISGIYDDVMEHIRKAYDMMVEHGVPEEDARYILPNACCTNIVVTMNARELRHFFGLRLCNRAQWEIREMARLMLDECNRVAPTLFEGCGPQCVQIGYCPEVRSCGRYPSLDALGEEYWIGHGDWKTDS